MKTQFWLPALAFGLVFAAHATVRGQGFPDPREMLKRLDANGNGMIDPDELEGRFGGFIRRMAEGNSRLDFSRPIPVDRMAEEFTRMRDERMRSGGFGGGPPGSGGGRDGGRDGGREGGRGSWGGPGGPWQGGGPGGGSGGPWGGGMGGPWGGGMGGPWGGPGGPSPGGPPGSDQNSPYAPRDVKIKPLVPGFGVDLPITTAPGFGGQSDLFNIKITDEDRREAERAFSRYDTNHDGRIDSEEMNRSQYGRDLPLFDRNHDGVITMNEMEFRYARRRMDNERDNRTRGPGERRDERGGRDRDRGSRDGDSHEEAATASSDVKKSFLRRTATRQLPKDIPDWFASSDKDNDGQVAMGEYASEWSDSVLAEFNRFDLNRDGVITPAEAVRAAKAGASRSGSSLVAAAPSPGPAAPPAAGSPAPPGTPAAAAVSPTPVAPATTAALPPIEARYLEYFKKVVAKYDTNHDGELTANEWAAMSKNPEAADIDRNGRITVEEYARWATQK